MSQFSFHFQVHPGKFVKEFCLLNEVKVFVIVININANETHNLQNYGDQFDWDFESTPLFDPLFAINKTAMKEINSLNF